MNREAVLAYPAYLGMIMLGALSPDHLGLAMSKDDVDRYPGMAKWRPVQRNLNAIV